MKLNLIRKKIGEEWIVGDITDEEKIPSVLMLHGAGNSCRQRFINIRKGLWDKDLSSLAFDFSGQGDSSSYGKSSLSQRVNESLPWWYLLEKSEIRCLIAFSMGAEIAIRLSETSGLKATHLILIAGALYDRAAYEVLFGETFSSIIRVYESWKNAETLEMLEKYEGHLTILSAEFDTVIPSELHLMMTDRAKAAKSVNHIILQGIEHQVALRTQKDVSFADQFVSILMQSLNQ